MAKMLDVYLNQQLVGELKQDDEGEMVFTYSSAWLDDPHAIAISYSLPLQKETFTRKECRAFFSGILPEQQQRKLIAKNLGISANNDFIMLKCIGGECAGAITFVPSGDKLLLNEVNYHALNEMELAAMIRELPYRPLLAGDRGVRLSLAGVQDKVAVYEHQGKISIPLDNAPSTHILKPAIDTYEGIIFNEAFCLNLAAKVGLPTAKAEIRKVEDIDYLLIARYDRQQIDGQIKRLHQEDFCQALRIVAEKKYQNEGGPSLKQCFDLIRKISSVPVLDLERLINTIIFNVLIGNCDAHGKNFSLLYKDTIELAPLYDLISTRYYKELSSKMAMKLGGEYEADKISMSHFEKLAEECGFSKPAIKKRVLDFTESVIETLKTIPLTHPVEEQIAALISQRAQRYTKSKS